MLLSSSKFLLQPRVPILIEMHENVSTALCVARNVTQNRFVQYNYQMKLPNVDTRCYLRLFTTSTKNMIFVHFFQLFWNLALLTLSDDKDMLNNHNRRHVRQCLL